MAEEKRYMPQSTAGLVRYFDVQETKFRLKPSQVMWLSIGFGGIVLALQLLL